MRPELGKSQSFNGNPEYCGWRLDEVTQVTGLMKRGRIRAR